MVCCVISGLEVIMFMRRDFAILWVFLLWCVYSLVFWCRVFTIASAMVIYVSKLPLGACSIRACSISKLWKWIEC